MSLFFHKFYLTLEKYEDKLGAIVRNERKDMQEPSVTLVAFNPIIMM